MRGAAAPAPGGGKVFTDAEMLAYLRQNVRYDGDCHLWAGRFMGRNMDVPCITWRGRTRSARRVLYELSRKVKLSTGRRVYPLCGDGRCMNEEHLRAGTRQAVPRPKLVRLLDRARNSKLPVTAAQRVFELQEQGYSYRRIAEVFGVSQARVYYALKSWEEAGITRPTKHGDTDGSRTARQVFPATGLQSSAG